MGQWSTRIRKWARRHVDVIVFTAIFVYCTAMIGTCAASKVADYNKDMRAAHRCLAQGGPGAPPGRAFTLI